MSLNCNDLKKIRMLSILLITLMITISMTSIALAATTVDVQDSSGKFTIRLTFPNGEGIDADAGHKVEGIDHMEFTKINIKKEWEYQDRVSVEIDVIGAMQDDWKLYYRDEVWDAGPHTRSTMKNWDDTKNEFALFWTTNPDRYDGDFYFIRVDSASGEAYFPFIVMPAADETDDFFVTPYYSEIEYGETIDFTLKKERDNIYTDIDDSEVDWVVAQSISKSDFRDKVTIGAIDNAGVFTTQDIGTCTIAARMGSETKAKAEVVVKCPSDKEGDLQEVIRLYKLRIPEGPYHRDLKAGKVWPPYKYMNPGYATNLYSLVNDEYGQFTCGGYQGQVLKYLHDMQSKPGECYLLNGYEFGPIEGSYGGHHAVVVYPEGTDWKKTGMVFDPWYHQKPEVMSISVWEDVFSPIAGDTSSAYRLNYNTTKDPKDYHYAAWTAAEALVRDTGGLVGFGNCPVNLLITDDKGRRLGAVDENNMVFEIPGAFITRISDEEGGYLWYFTLPATNEYDMDITAFDRGTFELVITNTITDQTQYYGDQPIKDGEIAELELNPNDPTTILYLPDGSEVMPSNSGSEAPSVSQDYRLIFESRSKPKGTSLQIPITLKGQQEPIGNMDLTLTYDDSVLKATEVIKSGLTDDSLFTYNIIDDTIKVGLVDMEGFSGGGSLAYVKFDVIGSEGLSSPLKIGSAIANEAENYGKVEIETINGDFTVTSVSNSRGDSNGDLEFTAVDALYALQMSVGKIPEHMSMDMNSDNSITSIDASLILREVVKK